MATTLPSIASTHKMMILSPPIHPNQLVRRKLIVATRAVLLCLLVQFSGCGDSEGISTVEGIVTVNGKPVPNGSVSFSPLDGGKAVSAEIVEGRYLAERVARGPNRAHLNAFYLTGGTFIEFGIEYPEEKNLIPERYLTGIDIEVNEPLVQHDFELTSK